MARSWTLEGAAGTGRVNDVVRFIDQDGSLKDGATKEQLDYGFLWACEYGHERVVRLLLDRGCKPDVNFMHGQTGLHWAAYGGHAGVVALLLEAKLAVNAQAQIHRGTPLGWAIYGWNNPAPEIKNARYYEVVELLIRAGAQVDWQWLDSADRGSSLVSVLRVDSRMMAALRRA